MILNDVAMLAADTSRTRAYLQAMVKNNMVPSCVLLLVNTGETELPGQSKHDISVIDAVIPQENSDCWSEIEFDPAFVIIDYLKQNNINYQILSSLDINSHEIIKKVKALKQEIIIYSGFGGRILGKDILMTGKRFLHVHGGFLPGYKGSTTNYYSLLQENMLGASSLFLNEKIDSGPVLLRKKFPPPADRFAIDHLYDSAARAKVLVETLKLYKKNGLTGDESINKGGETFYIIHPVLKHIAILSGERKNANNI